MSEDVKDNGLEDSLNKVSVISQMAKDEFGWSGDESIEFFNYILPYFVKKSGVLNFINSREFKQ